MIRIALLATHQKLSESAIVCETFWKGSVEGPLGGVGPEGEQNIHDGFEVEGSRDMQRCHTLLILSEGSEV